MNNNITIINNTFHEGNNTNCFNYFQANFKDKIVIVKIIPHLPTRNIINFVKKEGVQSFYSQICKCCLFKW